MTLQDVHHIVKVQMSCNFRVEDVQLLGRALEAYRDAQNERNWVAIEEAEYPQAIREINATEALLTRIS